MSEPILTREHVEYLLFDWLDVALPEAFDRETVIAVLDLAERLGIEHFLPHYRAADKVEPYLDADGVHILPEIRDAIARYVELGLSGSSFSADQGGMGLPMAASLSIYAILSSANISATSYMLLTAANARLVTTFGSPSQARHFAAPQIAGQWGGTMCLSEPQAGSSLGDIVTRAVEDGEDELGQRFRIFGNKMWISGGDQDANENIVHLVLAKIVGPDGKLPAGTRGISLFLVPKILPCGTPNDIAIAGLNHKMGYRGSSNCLMNFGENGGALGWLVGEAGQGLAQMFQMMNEARIGVGMGAAVLAYRGYRHALAYARERRQGRHGGGADGPPVPIVEHADVRRMLMQQKVYAEGSVALCLFGASLIDAGTEEADALVSLLTPVIKSWPSEFGLIANDLAIQVHGGYGYTRDFDVEQLWRDNRLNSIHEGTTGIQALDLLRRKIVKSDGVGMRALRERIAGTTERVGPDTGLLAFAEALTAYWDRVEAVVDGVAAATHPHAFDNATLFVRAFGHGIVGWLWLDQAVRAAELSNVSRLADCRNACRYFLDYEFPPALAWLSIVDARSASDEALPLDAFA